MASLQELLLREDVKEAMVVAKANPMATNKRLRPVDTPAGLIVIINPSKGQWNVFRTAVWDDDKSVASKSMEGLIKTLIVYPDAKTIAEWDADCAGLWDNKDLVLEVQRHARQAKEADAK
jgi:hypothetical protein